MNKLSLFILRISLPLLAISPLFFAESAAADSIIRLIGDRTTQSPDSTSAAPPSSSVRESTTIRIVGDKPDTTQSPTRVQMPPPAQNQLTAPIKEIRIIGDKIETVQKKVPKQPVTNEGEKEPKAKAPVNEDNKTPEQQLARRLEILKAEENRKAAEKAEQERLEQVKVEQDKKADEAARLEAIQNEQELLAAHKAEELRKAAEKEEQERLAKFKADQEKAAEAARQEAIKQEQERLATRKAEELRKEAEKIAAVRAAALKAEEERSAAARKALTEPSKTEGVVPSLPSATIANTDSLPAAGGLGTATNKDVGSDSDLSPAPSAIWDLYLFAKSNDPVLARTESRVVGSKADSDILLSGLLPHVDSSAGVNFISQTLANYNTPAPVSYDYSALNYNVTARIALLNVPALYSLSAAAAALNGEQAGVVAARQNLIVKFTDSYFALLKAQTDTQIARGEIYRLRQVLDQSQAFLKTGTGDVIAVYEAQSRLDGALADLTKSESGLRLAEQKLSSLVGKPVRFVVNYLPRQPAGPDPDNIDWWVATMEKEQPIIRQAREGLTQTSAQRKAAKAEYLPTVQASGGYEVSRGTADLPTAEVRQWFVGASISLPLYSGGETSAKVRRAVASEEERQHSFDETMDQQRESVKQAYFNLRYNSSLIKALEQKKSSAEIQLLAVKKGRKIGTRNAIDVLNADQAYSLALRDYTYALYDNIIRVIQLKSAAGILAEADIYELSKITAPPPASELNMLVSHASR